MKYMNIQIQEAQLTPSKIKPKRQTLKYYNLITKRQRDNLESSKKKANCHVQGILNIIIS